MVFATFERKIDDIERKIDDVERHRFGVFMFECSENNVRTSILHWYVRRNTCKCIEYLSKRSNVVN